MERFAQAGSWSAAAAQSGRSPVVR
jgi:hypothetical protein